MTPLLNALWCRYRLLFIPRYRKCKLLFEKYKCFLDRSQRPEPVHKFYFKLFSFFWIRVFRVSLLFIWTLNKYFTFAVELFLFPNLILLSNALEIEICADSSPFISIFHFSAYRLSLHKWWNLCVHLRKFIVSSFGMPAE